MLVFLIQKTWKERKYTLNSASASETSTYEEDEADNNLKTIFLQTFLEQEEKPVAEKKSKWVLPEKKEAKQQKIQLSKVQMKESN